MKRKNCTGRDSNTRLGIWEEEEPTTKRIDNFDTVSAKRKENIMERQPRRNEIWPLIVTWHDRIRKSVDIFQFSASDRRIWRGWSHPLNVQEQDPRKANSEIKILRLPPYKTQPLQAKYSRLSLLLSVSKVRSTEKDGRDWCRRHCDWRL